MSLFSLSASDCNLAGDGSERAGDESPRERGFEGGGEAFAVALAFGVVAEGLTAGPDFFAPGL